jgi:hypothetical protein
MAEGPPQCAQALRSSIAVSDRLGCSALQASCGVRRCGASRAVGGRAPESANESWALCRGPYQRGRRRGAAMPGPSDFLRSPPQKLDAWLERTNNGRRLRHAPAYRNAPCRSEQGAEQFTPQRTIVVDPGDGWQLRQLRCIRQHFRKRYYSAREPCEKNLIHSAVQSAVDWGD